MRLRCGHTGSRSYAEEHHGLCRKCHSSFSFLLDLEQKYGEDALVQYWYGLILSTMSSNACIVDHLIEFYQNKLSELPSHQSYIRKMLYMLNSIKDPFKAEHMV